MKKKNFWIVAAFATGLILAFSGTLTLDRHAAQAESGAAGSVRLESNPLSGNPGLKVVHAGAFLAHDDGSAEIHTGSVTEPLVVACRFVPGEPLILSSVSFYTSGTAAGDPAEIVIYEDRSGLAPAPDPSMEVFREEITLGQGGFQVVGTGGLMLNATGSPEAAFYVGLANVAPRSFSLGIDMSGAEGGATFISEDGGYRFVPISEFPVIDGNAMIRAHRAGAIPFGHSGPGPLRDRIRGRIRMGERAEPLMGEAESFLHIGSSSEGARGDETRATLINDDITATSGSGSCPGCTPALTPGYPRFTVGNPDLYEDYMTIENSSGSGIAMPIRTVLGTLTPVSVEAFNPDGGGVRPPDGYWEYSLSNNDGTDSADNTLDPGEKITRLWRVADDGGDTFTFWVDVYSGSGADGDTVLLLHGDGDASASVHTFEAHGNPTLNASTKKLGAGSMYFDGNGDYLSIPDSEDWDFGFGDFTFEFWMRTTVSGVQDYLISRWSGTYIDWGISLEPGGYLRAYGSELSDNSYPLFLVGSTHVNDGDWHHIAVVRSGSDAYLFIDGILEVSDTSATCDITHSTPLQIGADGQSGRQHTGYFDEIRISKGVARWTSNFTPPAGPYGPDAETRLLLHLDGDESGSDHAVTFNGDPSVDAGTSKWNGSLYFDGSGDYLSISDSDDWNFGAGDFTIDFWINWETVQDTGIGHWEGGGIPGFDGNSWLAFYYSNTLSFWWSTNGTDYHHQDTPWSPTGSTWYHIAITRDSDLLRFFVNGTKISPDISFSDTIHDGDIDLNIGATPYYDSNYHQGYFDEIRISKGVARWTSDFTPPTAPYE